MCGALPCDKPDCTHGDAHRAACEARTVMKWPKHQRQAYYGMVGKSRGALAAAKLSAEVSAEWRKQGERE